MNTHNPANIRRGITVLGVAALVVGMITAVVLYWSFGTTLVEKLGYALAGIIYACMGGLLLPASVALWGAEKPVAATGVFLFWAIVILPIGLSGHTGFFSLAQNELAASSIGAKVATADLEAASAKASQLAGASTLDVTSLKAQADALQSDLRDAVAARMACNQTHTTKCVNPAIARAEAIKQQLNPIEQQLRDANSYAAALQEKRDAMVNLKAESTGATVGGLHPLFVTLSRLLNIDAARIQAGFLGWSAVALELIASISFIIAGSLAQTSPSNAVQGVQGARGHIDNNAPVEGRRDAPEAPLPIAGVSLLNAVPQLSTGGFITKEGLAYLHADELVLTAEETREYLAERAARKQGASGGVRNALQSERDALQDSTQCVTQGQNPHKQGFSPLQNERSASGGVRDALQSKRDALQSKRDALQAQKAGLLTLQCECCGATFKQRTLTHRFCSNSCRASANRVVKNPNQAQPE